MVAILSAVVSIFVFRFRSRAALELKLVALQHQLAVLRRQRPIRPQLSSLDRLLWVLLYRIWPKVIDAMVLVKPATVVEWHRKGFRFCWRWRSRGPGRPRISANIRDLIRRMSRANPLWGAPRIHGELLKLGIKISQATVGRWMPWRPKVPSPTWRSFLRNHLPDIAAIDMFVVATATFHLLYGLIVLSLDRRRVVHFAVTPNPTQDWLSRQMTEAFPWDTAPRYLLRDRDKSYGPAFRHRVRAMGITEVITAPRSPWQNPTLSVSSVRSAENAWITSSSSTSAICAAFYRAIFNTIMTSERIFRSARTARGLVPYNLPRPAISLPSRKLAVCTIAMSVEPPEGKTGRSCSYPAQLPSR
jgi:putative transposase